MSRPWAPHNAVSRPCFFPGFPRVCALLSIRTSTRATAAALPCGLCGSRHGRQLREHVRPCHSANCKCPLLKSREAVAQKSRPARCAFDSVGSHTRFLFLAPVCRKLFFFDWKGNTDVLPGSRLAFTLTAVAKACATRPPPRNHDCTTARGVAAAPMQSWSRGVVHQSVLCTTGEASSAAQGAGGGGGAAVAHRFGRFMATRLREELEPGRGLAL